MAGFIGIRILVKDGNRYGAVPYGDLRTQFAPSNFIETGNVPSDAEVVGHTWAHPNKSGGPDRRFKNNRQIPICRYEALRLSSASGLNELVEFSKTNVSQPFCQAITALAQVHGAFRSSPPSAKQRTLAPRF
ncbi:MAG: hypothetical protein E5Y35_06670 [Mesorhizobium sp.]|uniref:hypothetical protein n=1 Tax=Mesorhizobium sp. M1A.F.Ca.IN.020.32.1.1 TaxID=2496763 RepID=UPI000FD53150|nr:hypothetical protein [Mesorhizobium sp. M1A.F.Ca.IN.020.32.1.1]RWF83241.1 MAG: hypothetical protein EOQ35_06810 [Mesorhizobium sp.]RUV82596.1 hypothetical protein EOA51_28035 [Mesorhizobium sp. M1A.F.Ca.IN.020.32.1.1]RWG06584.1 MAG: hypothetical protein EOQ38_01450 [Mesorhizobium sp.]RWG92758.1 MAG: hypothetical protein EOQ68_00870 [Mesorhizobium sp.]RWH06705.1 MAG: hypothetical protein EOQ73_04565 [Mesorhizobium sp.]